MKVTVDKQPNCKAILTIEVPAEKVSQARNQVTELYAKSASVPGFRPGKAPRAIVAKRFASDIHSRAIQNLNEEVLRDAIANEKLDVLSIDEAKMDEKDGAATCTFNVTLRPEVSLPDYKGLKIEIQKLDITEEFVDKIIRRQTEQFATQKDVTDRAAQLGDFCVIDYDGSVDGTPIKDLVKESESFLASNVGFLFKLDEKNFLPGFAEQLVGANVGDSRSVKVTVPEMANPAIAGKEAVYEVTVTSIKEQELPEVNDEFASRLLPGKNLEELRAFVRERVEADSESAQLNQKRANVLTALTGQSEFDLPKTLVDRATQRRINELVNTNLRQGITQDLIQENEASIIGAASSQASVDVKQEFLLLEIAKAENLKVSDEDWSAQVIQIAQQNKIAPQKVVKQLQKNNQINNLATGILLEKTVKFLIDHADITYKTITPEEAEAAAAAEQEEG
jgi:trigger factor